MDKDNGTFCTIQYNIDSTQKCSKTLTTMTIVMTKVSHLSLDFSRLAQYCPTKIAVSWKLIDISPHTFLIIGINNVEFLDNFRGAIYLDF